MRQANTQAPILKQPGQAAEQLKKSSREESVAETRTRLLGLPKRRSAEILKALEKYNSFALTLEVPSKYSEGLMQSVEAVFIHGETEKGEKALRVLASGTSLLKPDTVIPFGKMPAYIKTAYDAAKAQRAFD